ncbi:MAG: NAD(P)-dependent oxidoreductase, partial [Gammaproteobacteria bacterium]|nr:NAD(P)-dependent oxidoreductase [Gammaproteobacteria bacterium]NIO61467.1 NAD(P)-dependent oxidoreductase [Gammaproteobacteria bacterium]
ESPATLAAQCELIVTCVSRDEDVIEMAEVVADKINKDAILVDTSTVSADTAKKCAEIISSQGAHFLDCPVS